MPFLLNKYIIYMYNDSSLSFLSGFYRLIGNSDALEGSTLTVLVSNKIDILTSLIQILLSHSFNFIVVNNMFLITAVILSFVFALRLFIYINNKTNTATIFALLYTFSIYFLFRVISATQALYFTFVFPATIHLLLKKTQTLILGLIVFVFSMISNYYGFFLFMLVYLSYFSDIFFKKNSLKHVIKNIFMFSLSFLFFSVIFVGPLLYKNIPLFGNYAETHGEEFLETDSHSVYRAMDDWYAFSLRPWYLFIQPKSSIFFGEFSRRIHQRISEGGYYLADDYMEEEMAGSYMGWHFLLGLLVVATLLILKKYKNKEFPVFKSVYENKEMILRSFFIIFCILLISGPPSFTIRGIEIYTPTYLLYYIIPVFRTLVRWAVVIYLFVLIINSFLVQDLYNLMKNKFQKALFIVSFLALNFVIFAIKIPVININKPPQEIAYVKETYPESVPYAVYPKGDYYSAFWIISHEDLLVNPPNYINYKNGFDSDEFSRNLITNEGINKLKEKETKYLLYYPMRVSEKDLSNAAKINNLINSREDIEYFFELFFGKGVALGDAYLFITDK